MKAIGSKFFLSYQAKWIKDRSRLKIIEKSRQIGISLASAYEDVRHTAPADNDHDTWVSSRDAIQARLYLEDCKQFADILQQGAVDIGEEVIDEEKRISAYVLQFANKKRINSMSSNPDAQAGKRGNRKLDEFALHPDQRKLYAIAYPGITWGGSMAIISTHRGSHSLFNELIQEIKFKGNPKGFSLHTVTLWDALKQGFLGKLKGKLPKGDVRHEMTNREYFEFIRKGCPDEETFLQEYMCQPSDDASAFLSYDLIQSCEYDPGTIWEWDWPMMEDAKNQLYAGLDIGRKHDLTSLWIAEKVGGIYFTRKQIDLKNMAFSQQEQILYPYFALPQMRRVCIDSSGMGSQFAERAQERFGTHKIEAVTFTGPVKEELAYPLKAAFEDKTIRIPNTDLVRSDLRAIKKVTTAAGNIRFEADRGKNGHSDRFWGIALMLHAAQKASGPFGYTTIPTPRGRDRIRSYRHSGVLI